MEWIVEDRRGQWTSWKAGNRREKMVEQKNWGRILAIRPDIRSLLTKMMSNTQKRINHQIWLNARCRPPQIHVNTITVKNSSIILTSENENEIVPKCWVIMIVTYSGWLANRAIGRYPWSQTVEVQTFWYFFSFWIANLKSRFSKFPSIIFLKKIEYGTTNKKVKSIVPTPEDYKLHWPTALVQTNGRHCEAAKFTSFCHTERDGGGRLQSCVTVHCYQML